LACHNANIHLLDNSKSLTIRDIPDCFQFILWDAASDSLQSIKLLQQPEKNPLSNLAN
jgi:omega-6 fatty acid desaturase (delta-12 desaturase)